MGRFENKSRAAKKGHILRQARLREQAARQADPENYVYFDLPTGENVRIYMYNPPGVKRVSGPDEVEVYRDREGRVVRVDAHSSGLLFSKYGQKLEDWKSLRGHLVQARDPESVFSEMLRAGYVNAPGRNDPPDVFGKGRYGG